MQYWISQNNLQAFISMQWQETLLSIWQVHPHLDFFLLIAFSKSQGYWLLVISHNSLELAGIYIDCFLKKWAHALVFEFKELSVIWLNRTIYSIFWFTIRLIEKNKWHMHTYNMHCEIIKRLSFKCRNKCKMPLEFNISLVWNLKEKHKFIQYCLFKNDSSWQLVRILLQVLEEIIMVRDTVMSSEMY